MQLNKSEDFVSNIPLVMYLPLNAFSCVTFAFCLLVLAADSAVALAVVKARVCDLRLLVFCSLVYWNSWTCDLYSCCTDMVLAWDHHGAYFGPVSDASFAGSCHSMLLCLSTTTGCQKKGTQCNYYSSAQPAQSFHVPHREYIFAILFLTMQLLAQTAARQEHRPVAKSTRPYNTRIYKATD